MIENTIEVQSFIQVFEMAFGSPFSDTDYLDLMPIELGRGYIAGLLESSTLEIVLLDVAHILKIVVLLEIIVHGSCKG